MLMKTRTTLMVFLLTAALIGCSTATSFRLPPNTEILVKGERATIKASDDNDTDTDSARDKRLPYLRTSPFFWNAMGGIKYSLVQGDKVVKEGTLPAQFRIASIFWPPYAIFYWPVGFRFKCYDLTKDYVEKCPSSQSAAGPDSSVAKSGLLQNGPQK